MPTGASWEESLEMAQLPTFSRPMENKFLPIGLRTWAGPEDVFKIIPFP